MADKFIVEFEAGQLQDFDSGCVSAILDECAEHGRVVGLKLQYEDGSMIDSDHAVEFITDNTGYKPGKC